MRKYVITTFAIATLAVFAFTAWPARAATAIVGFISRPSEAADLKGDNNGIGAFNRNEANKQLKKVWGTVTEISDTSITIMSKFDRQNSTTVTTDTSYTFEIDSTTKILRRFRALSSVSEMSVGDQVRIWATSLTDGTAKLIWDKSIWWIRQTGTISNLNAVTETFSLLITRAAADGTTKTFSIKVKTNDMTLYVKADGTAGTWADLANDDQVRVRGVWNHVDREVMARNIRLLE